MAAREDEISAVLKSGFKISSIGLLAFLSYKVVINGIMSTKYFSNNEMKAIYAMTLMNELVIWYYFEKIMAHDPKIQNNKTVKKIIFGAALFYGSTLIVSNSSYSNYTKYITAAIVVSKTLVGLPWITKLKLQTMEDALLFGGVVMAITFGMITRQLFNA